MPPITPIVNDIPEIGSADVGDNVQVINIMSDSDSISDEENAGHEGYEPLSQDPDSYIDNQCDLEEDNFLAENEPHATEIDMISQHSFLLPLPNAHDITLETNTVKGEDFNMDEKHIETIKSVMKGVTLPSTNLPQWATVVPEEEWKTNVLSEMLLKKSERHTSNGRNGNKKFPNYELSDFQNDIPR